MSGDEQIPHRVREFEQRRAFLDLLRSSLGCDCGHFLSDHDAIGWDHRGEPDKRRCRAVDCDCGWVSPEEVRSIDEAMCRHGNPGYCEMCETTRSRWADPVTAARTVPHGTGVGYTYHRCRCDPCRAAHTVNIWRRKQERLRARVVIGGRLVTIAPGVDHGHHSTYSNWGCRCEPCTRANTAQTRSYRAGGAS